MKTKLKTAHEEAYSDNSKTLGVLINYSIDTEQPDWKESFIYIFNNGTYIFFDTITNMFNYLVGERKIKRAYMSEDDFDLYYDTDFIDGQFNGLLVWTDN